MQKPCTIFFPCGLVPLFRICVSASTAMIWALSLGDGGTQLPAKIGCNICAHRHGACTDDEMHMIFECPTVQAVREQQVHLFSG